MLAAGVILWASLLGFAPARALAFDKAIWGQVTYRGVNQFPLYRQLGVSIYETDLYWYEVAPQRPSHPANPRDPAYHWDAGLSQAIVDAYTNHMPVMLQIIGAPRWANGGHGWQWTPTHPSAMAQFATAAAREYPQVRLWMIWGEPSHGTNYQPLTPAKPGAKLNAAQRVAPHNYARLLDAAYGALKNVNRRNKVIGGNTYTTGDIDNQQWIENLRLPNGKPPRMDMYGFNPFTFRAPNFSNPPLCCGAMDFSDMPRLATLLDHNLRPGLPLFLSEFTIPTAPDREFNYYVDPPVAGRWVADALRLARQWHRIYALGWVHTYDDPPRSSGGLLTVGGQPKPSFYAFEYG